MGRLAGKLLGFKIDIYLVFNWRRLFARFLNNKFSDSYTPTIENFYRKVYRIRGEVYQLDILDTSGNQFVTKSNFISFSFLKIINAFWTETILFPFFYWIYSPFPAMQRLSFITGKTSSTYFWISRSIKRGYQTCKRQEERQSDETFKLFMAKIDPHSSPHRVRPIPEVNPTFLLSKPRSLLLLPLSLRHPISEMFPIARQRPIESNGIDSFFSYIRFQRAPAILPLFFAFHRIDRSNSSSNGCWCSVQPRG